MNKTLLKICCTLCFLLLGIRSYATHIVGGELYYDCLGGDQYRITIKIYKDCSPGVTTGFDDPLFLTIFGSGNQVLQTLQIPLPGFTNVPFTPGNPCFQAPPNVCVQEAIYVTTVTLSGSPGGYTFAYQRCCRNNTILNILDPGGTGATYTETTPLNTVATCNNSPRFNHFPPIALCVGDSLIFDHSATDPDGDSLVYEFVPTFSGATPGNPMPNVASNPPYAPILFQAPFSANNPITSSPPSSINPQTGVLKVYPTQQGQFVVGVAAREYRNGVLIGIHRRDFQFNVTQCLVNTVSQFEIPLNDIQEVNGTYVSCGQLQVTFDNNSINSSYYYWDFGVPNITTDNSTQTDPTYTFPGPGTYQIMLVSNPGYFCADTSYQDLVVRPEFDPQITAPAPQCLAGNSFNFNVNGIYENGATFNWTFGGPSTPGTATGQTVNGVTYSSYGTFPVTLTANQFECEEIRTTEVTIIGPIVPSWEIDTSKGCVPHTAFFTYTGDNANVTPVFSWQFGDGGTSNLPNPSHVYGAPGSYDVSLTITDPTGCTAQTTINLSDAIEVFIRPDAGFFLTPPVANIFLSTIRFFDQSTGGIACQYDFGDGITSSNCNTIHEYLEAGNYWVVQTVTNEFGCPDTAVQKVIIEPEYGIYIPNAFTPDADKINPTYTVKGLGIDSFQIYIFNRWGEKIFESSDIYYHWNGRRNNADSGPIVPQDVYVYRIFVMDVFGREHEYFGHISVLY